MKLTTLTACGALLTAGLAGMAAAQQTGREALATVAREKGAALAGQIISLSGERGAEQPAAWRLVARDPAFPGRFREYMVKGGRVASEHAVPAAESTSYATAPLVRNKVKIDSPVVFWRAHTEAKKALVGFDTVNYELRNAEFSTTPVWVVGLQNAAGTRVGELAVSAESGHVLRRTWFEAGLQTAQRPGAVGVPKRTPAPVSQKAQQAWQGTRTGLKQGTDVVKTGLSKASTTVGGWLLRAGGANQTPATAPKPPTSGPSTWENGRSASGTKR
jgi:hypothetical protein